MTGSSSTQYQAQTTYYQQLGGQPLEQLEAQAPVTWQVGDVILDLYEIKALLGEGGMGKVFRAHHRGWNIDLAVKCPQPDLFTSQEGKDLYIKEAQTWVELGLHPHIASCYYVRSLGGAPRLFAECVEGGSLKDWIEDQRLYEGGKAQALERMLDIAIQFAWGLAYAHERGLVHQDVKPANVLMTPEGVVKVTDFGLANAVGKGGTPAYCSPEQARGEPLSLQTDIWSWGVSVLEMFVGEVFWGFGEAAADVLEGYLEEGTQVAGLPPMPPELVALLRQCFRQNPAERSKDMLEVAGRLQAIYQEEIGQAYPREMPKAAELRADSLNNKALSLLDLDQPGLAQAAWEEALKLEPHYPEVIYNLGLIQWRSAQITDEALLERLREAGGSHPGDWKPAYLQALVHLERGDGMSAGVALKSLQGQDVQRQEVLAASKLADSPNANTYRLVRTFEGHKYRGTSVCLSADGRHALSGSWDGTLKLWEVASGSCLRTFEGHNYSVNSVSLSPDGRYALSGGVDSTLRLWDVATRRCLCTLKGHTDWVNSVYLSADGRYALSGSKDQTLKLWEIDRVVTAPAASFMLSQVQQVQEALTRQQAFDRSLLQAQQLMAQGDSVEAARQVRQARAQPGFLLDPQALQLWQQLYMRLPHAAFRQGWKLQEFLGHQAGVNSVCLSAYGRYALSGSSDKTLKLWDVASGSCLRTFTGHTDSVRSVCLSADGRYALSGGGDQWKGELILWEVATGRCLRTFTGHTSFVKIVWLSADGRYALSGDYGQKLKLWEVMTGRCLRTFDRKVNEKNLVYLSTDGRYFLSPSRDHTLKLWSVASGRCLRTFEGHTVPVESVCLSADECYALSGDGSEWKRALILWEVATGRLLRTFKSLTERVTSVSLSADGRYALSGSIDNTLRLWEVATGRGLRIIEGHKDGVESVCLSADGHYALSGSQDKTLKLWEVASGRCLRTFEGHTDYANSVCLSAEGRYALSGSKDNTLKLWEVETGSCLRTFEGHTSWVFSVCLSADGRYALSGSRDKTLKLWEVETGRCLRTFEGHTSSVSSVCLSADGRYALSGSVDKTLKLWALDWELEDKEPADWDEGARPHLENFLTLHTPYAGALPQDRRPTEEEITMALTRRGAPTWTEEDFKGLLYTLGCAGYGWLRPEGVRRELERMAVEFGTAGFVKKFVIPPVEPSKPAEAREKSSWLSKLIRKDK